MSAAARTARKRAGGTAQRRGTKTGGTKTGRTRPDPRAVFSIALSLFAVPLALAGLLVPLPAGLAALLTAGIALFAGRKRAWPRRIARAALLLALGSLIGGFAIGLAVTG